MKPKLLFYFLFVLIVMTVLAGCSGPGKYDSFAKCLTEKGVKMYGTDWCSHCKNQKSLFDKSFKYIDYVDCDWNRDECTRAGVRGYPTWKINGENYPGEQSFYELSSLTGCELFEED
jgi:glutaredoxin